MKNSSPGEGATGLGEEGGVDSGGRGVLGKKN